MSIKRFPLFFLVGGVGFKALLVILWRIFQPAFVGRLLVRYDPVGVWFADFLTPLVFDQRRFAPTPAEAIFYELALIIAFGLQCLLIGILISGVRHWLHRRHGEVPV